jgi:hypothetical protein
MITFFKKICGENSKGIAITYVLVFGTIFLILFTALLGFLVTQSKQTKERTAWNDALNIAESGIDYYRWCINNNVEEDCLTEKDYFDPSGKSIGKFTLSVNNTLACGQSIKREIVSNGQIYDFPQLNRKISAIYGRASVGKFSYVLDSNVWIGEDHDIRGPYHSNGGIRMDGANQSLVTSGLSEFNCTSTLGCDPGDCPTTHGCHTQSGNCICPGVFTTTGASNPGLFNFPVDPFSFPGITIDLGQMKTAATTSGIYLPPATTTDSTADGYHIKFLANGTFEIWIITSLSGTSAYSNEEGDHTDYFTIATEYRLATSSIPSACSVIFVEDNLWVEGTIKGKVSIVSANLISSNVDTSVVLPGNINYSTLDGSDGLLVIAEKNMLIGPQSPDQMVLRGIFTAQKGRFARNHYIGNRKDTLEIYGSVVSKGRVGTKWTNVSTGEFVSGYENRESYFDSNLIYDPPAFASYTDPEFKILNWQEVK